MCKERRVLADHMQAQLNEMLGPVNRYFAGIALGHSPSDEEAIWHYLHNGGPENFRQRRQGPASGQAA